MDPCFFDREYKNIINTNNSIYLKNHVNKSLCHVLQIIITQFFVDCFEQYRNNNATLSNKYKPYKEEIPEFLHDQPMFFIKHVYQRNSTTLSVYCRESITTLTTGENLTICLVKSKSNVNKTHCVDFTSPTCTYDFFKYRYPCKHILAVIIFFLEVCFYVSTICLYFT